MLTNITVIAVDAYLAGPFATRMLSDLGAEVIKIESTGGGDAYRYLNHDYDEGVPEDLTHRFMQYNRGKQSVALDLQDEQGQQIFKELATDADVILENLKPDSMDSFGLGYEDIQTVTDDIIYCSISGFGASGPYKNRPAVDTIIQAMSGVVSQNAADADSPTLTGIYIADMLGGMYAAMSILAALASPSEDTAYIDVSMFDCLVSILNHEAAEYSARGTAPPRTRSGLVPQGVYETADGAIALNVLDEYWPAFCDILDLEDLKSKYPDSLTRQEHKDMIENRVEEVLKAKSSEYWLDQLLAADIMAAPVKSVDEALTDESILDRRLVRERTSEAMGEYIELDFPAKFSNYETSTDEAPRFGEDTLTVLRALGYSDEEIQAMLSDNIINATKT